MGRRSRIALVKLALVVGALAVAALPCALRAAQRIVVPNDRATVGAPWDTFYPFAVPADGFTSQRYQQVYHADQFGALTGPTRLTHIAFRPDENTGGAFGSNVSNLRVKLSTTARLPDALGAQFAFNVGADEAIVHDGPITFVSTDTGNPPAFDVVIPLQSPFDYDPAAGNLLMEVQNFGPSSYVTFLDAQGSFGDSMSRIYTVAGANANSDTANGADQYSIGLVTQFTFVPEPGAASVAAIAPLLLRRTRRP
jgi:hypothetical protein